MNLNIPKRAFFNFAAPCPYREDVPVLDGDLKEWDDRYLLPDLTAVEEKEAYADFYAAWNDDGLFFAVQINGASSLNVDSRRPQRSDGIQLWVDTRDVRNAHRASRYCHHFVFLPGKGRTKPLGRQFRIRRARAQARLCDSGDLRVASKTVKPGYQMEIHLPKAVLTGFDPDENTRLGFTYLLRDKKLGRQYWSANETVPVSYDPSLWGTLELVK